MEAMRRRGWLPLAIAIAVGASTAAAGTAPLVPVGDIPLPGPPVRFDYQSVDTTSGRLYISHMNAGELVVFDLARGRVERTISGLPRVTGVCAAPALGKVYASVPGDHEVAVIDARTLEVKARVGKIGFPDGIAYAPTAHKVFVSDESGGGETVIDASTNRVTATIPIGGEAGNSIYDPVSDRVLVAVQTRDEVVAIDPRADRVTGHYPLQGAAHPHGMSLDPFRRLLFVANERNGTLLTVDLRTWKTIDTHRVGEDPDVLAFDAAVERLYVASESGVVSVFSERGGRLVHDGDVRFPHAHTVAVDPRTHRVYLPLQDVGGRPLLRVMAPGPLNPR
ncbi:MAG: YncE family protein [Bacteroidota bacterium]